MSGKKILQKHENWMDLEESSEAEQFSRFW